MTQIKIDPGAVRCLPEECQRIGMKKPLVVSDAGGRAAGVLDLARAALGPLPHAVFDGTPSNPTEAVVRAALAVYQAQGCDGLISVGGGSRIDLAKGVAVLASQPDARKTCATIEGGSNKFTGAAAPLIFRPLPQDQPAHRHPGRVPGDAASVDVTGLVAARCCHLTRLNAVVR